MTNERLREVRPARARNENLLPPGTAFVTFSRREKVAVRPDEGDVARSGAMHPCDVRSVKDIPREMSGRVTLTRRAYARRPLPAGQVFSESLRDGEVKLGFGRPKIVASGPKLLWKLGRHLGDTGS